MTTGDRAAWMVVSREVAVESWRPVEDLIRWGFGHAPVVTANEAQLIGTALDLGETLAAYGGTAGILRDQAPPPLDGRIGVDALIVSTDNELTP